MRISVPVLVDLETPVVFRAVNATPQRLDIGGVVAFPDPDDHFCGSTLTLSGLLAGDTVSFRDQGTGAGPVVCRATRMLRKSASVSEESHGDLDR